MFGNEIVSYHFKILIPLIFSHIVHVFINSYPFSLICSITETNKFGFVVGVVNAAVIFGQILSSILYIVMRTLAIVNNYENSLPLYDEDILKTSSYFMMFELPLSMIAVIVSLSLVYLRKIDPKNLRPDYDNFAENQLNELMEMDDLDDSQILKK